MEILFMEESLLAAYWRVTPIPKDGVLDVFWEDIFIYYNYMFFNVYQRTI